jgi:hypothetical protein
MESCPASPTRVTLVIDDVPDGFVPADAASSYSIVKVFHYLTGIF